MSQLCGEGNIGVLKYVLAKTHRHHFIYKEIPITVVGRTERSGGLTPRAMGFFSFPGISSPFSPTMLLPWMDPVLLTSRNVTREGNSAREES